MYCFCYGDWMIFSFKKAHNRIVKNFSKRVLSLLVLMCVLSFASLYSIHGSAMADDGEQSIGIGVSATRTPTAATPPSGDGKVVRVGWYEASYNYTDKFGRKTGIAYEYQQKIATYTGWDYEYVEGTWPELLQMLLNGDIDLLSDVSFTAERANSILYPSLPMGTEAYYIYVSPSNTDLMSEDVSVFNNKKFAVNKGSVQEKILKDWARTNGITIDIVEIFELSNDESIDLLQTGEIDALVSLDTYGRREECVPVNKIGSSDYYFAVSGSRPDLLADLDHALKSIQNEDPFYNQRLYQKYIWAFNTGIIFTKEEREWLESNNTIKVGYRDDYEPFCFEDNGSVSGALKDYLEYASESIEGATINYEAVAYKTTEEAIAALKAGEIDVVFPVSMSAYESEEGDLFITIPVMSSEIYVLVRTGGDKAIFEDEMAKVALLEGNVNFDNFVKDYFPEWEIIWKPNLEKVYASVANGEADCAMVNGYRINTNDRLRRRYKLSLLDTGEKMDFSFAVRRDDKILFQILDKTVGVIEEPVVDTMLSKYTNTANKVTFSDYLRDNQAVVLAVTTVLVFFILFLILARLKSDKMALERQKLIDATEHDALTGLYTRNFFFEYSSRMYRENPSYMMDAIVMNIEQFHVVNALYGWAFGDTVLKALGDEIKDIIGESDGIACRTTADRFEIYTKHIDDYQNLFDRFQRKLDECTKEVNIMLRMGVMPWQKDLEPVQLFDRARAACNMTMSGHHSKLVVFNEEMRTKEILDQRLLNDLKNGLENKEFLVYFQPKYNVQVDLPVIGSAEALVRWKHHELGMIPPGDFISLFEKSGQIGLLDRYVWTETARYIADWKEKYGKVIPISVNLSRIDIFDPDLEKTIEGIVEETGIGRENLHLEVTESAYTEGEEQILEVIRRFRSKGYHIEMDDFGTGYSSLNMLSRMSIDVLKLDRSFIKDIKGEDDDSKNVQMVELILDIARSLKLVVVAEGVETKEQMEFLKKRGCDLIQGFYFSKPLPADEFEEKAFKS